VPLPGGSATRAAERRPDRAQGRRVLRRAAGRHVGGRARQRHLRVDRSRRATPGAGLTSGPRKSR